MNGSFSIMVGSVFILFFFSPALGIDEEVDVVDHAIPRYSIYRDYLTIFRTNF